MIRQSILLLLSAAAGFAQGWNPVPAYSFQAQQNARSDPDYQRGLGQLDARQWEQAIDSFSASAARGGADADAALYWKAYAQNRAGRGEAALLTVAQLREKYSSSRWIKDGRALELEVRAQTGSPVSPSSEPDDDLKLMAVNSLMQSNPNAAFPVVEKVLSSGNSDRVKEQALFVLAQSPLPEAGKLLGTIANGSSNPVLQLKAIRLMGMMGNENSRKQLSTLYGLSSDLRIKRAILQSYMQSGSRDLLLHAAKTETDPQLRRDAIRQLALAGGEEQLWQLYQSDNSVDDRKAVLESMFLSGNSGRLAEIARTDNNPELRASAIKSLGLMGGNGRADVLTSIFQHDKNDQVRQAVLNALFLQQNGKALVDLARQEKDPQVKRQIVSKMALIQSKEVTEYMTELLK